MRRDHAHKPRVSDGLFAWLVVAMLASAALFLVFLTALTK